jgi:chromosome segregation ATPase
VDSYKDALSNVLGEKKELIAALDATRNEKEVLAEATTSKIASLTEEIEKLKASECSMAATINNKEAESECLKQRIATFEREISEKAEEIERLSRSLVESNVSITSLSDQKEVLLANVTTHEAQIAALERKIEEQCRESQAAAETRATLDLQVQSILNDRRTELTAHESARAAMEQEISLLSVSLSDKNGEIDALRAELASLRESSQTEIDLLKQQILYRENQLQAVEQTFKNATQLILPLRAQALAMTQSRFEPVTSDDDDFV